MQGKPLVTMLAVLYGGAFLAGFNENLVNMALMSIMSEYGIGSVTAQWLVTGYMIVATVMVACMAYFYRRFKLRTLFFAASALSLGGSLMGLFAQNFAFLLIARLVQALGTGIFIPLMMNTILAVTPKNKLGTYLSIGSCMITFGPAFAPVICGSIVTAFGWHNVFLPPAIAMAIIAAAGFFFVKDLDTHDAHLDMPSVILATGVLFCLSFGLAELAMHTVLAVASLVCCAAGTAAFIMRQLRCDHPLIDLAPARSIRFWPTLLLVTVAMMSTFSMSVLLPLYYEGALGTTALFAGIIMLAPVLVNTVITLIAGRIMDKRGEWPLLPIGFAVVTLGFIVVALAAPSLSLAAMLIGSVIAYAGVGLIFSTSQTAGLRTLPPDQHPFGVALSTTFVQIAACIGPSLYTGIMASVQSGALASGADAALSCAQGFGAAMSVAAVVACIGLATAFAYSLAARKRALAAAAQMPDASKGAGIAHEDGVGNTGNARTRNAGTQTDGRLRTVGAFMEENPYTLCEDATVAQAMRAFSDKRVSGMPVVDAHGRGVGFLSDGDIMRLLAERHPLVIDAYSLIAISDESHFDERLSELMTLPVKDVASSELVSIDEDATLEEACNLLSRHKLKKVPVLRGKRVVGTVNRSALIRLALERAASMAS